MILFQVVSLIHFDILNTQKKWDGWCCSGLSYGCLNKVHDSAWLDCCFECLDTLWGSPNSGACALFYSTLVMTCSSQMRWQEAATLLPHLPHLTPAERALFLWVVAGKVLKAWQCCLWMRPNRNQKLILLKSFKVLLVHAQVPCSCHRLRFFLSVATSCWAWCVQVGCQCPWVLIHTRWFPLS